MSGRVLDTSVIVPALLTWHEHHRAALRLVQQALRAEAAVVVPLPALMEAFAVMTRLPEPWRVRPEDAFHLLLVTFRRSARIVALDGDEGWTLPQVVPAE